MKSGREEEETKGKKREEGLQVVPIDRGERINQSRQNLVELAHKHRLWVQIGPV